MKMIHLTLEQLTLSPLNVRKIGGKEIADLLPSIRSLGIIQPLLVRQIVEDGSDDAADASGADDGTGADSASKGAGGGKNTGAAKRGRAGKAGAVDAGAVDIGAADTTGKPGDRAGTGTASRYEIVAGQRRYHALCKLAVDGIADPVPCMVMEDGEDAKAVEASLSENIARLPMDEIDQYKAFSALQKTGLDIPEIASRYGVTERLVGQRLAIATIMQPILNAYRREEIGADTLRAMTMATPRQQKAWWKLFRDEEAYAPQGRALREWLLGGAQIPVTNALFDPEAYGGAIISDLFGEDSFFADPDQFWSLQMAAIAEKRDTYLANGWSDVIVQEPGEWFRNWDYRKLPKSKGGKVIVSLTKDGEATFHEGYVTEKEAKALEKALEKKARAKDDNRTNALTGAGGGKSELTKAMRNYLGLHKHGAVRTELLAHPGIALRLTVAHLIAGSSLWNVKADPRKADSPAIHDSIASSEAERGFAEERARIRLLLGMGTEGEDESGEIGESGEVVENGKVEPDDSGDDAEPFDGVSCEADGHDDEVDGSEEADEAEADPDRDDDIDPDDSEADEADDNGWNEDDDGDYGEDTEPAAAIIPRAGDWHSRPTIGDLFEALIQMKDSTVHRVLAFAMAETLEAHSGTVEALGMLFGTDMRNWWSPDQTFFDLLRDKQAINAILREVAGDMTADAHTASTAKVQKGIIADCLTGANGRAKAENWLPRYMAFPEGAYVGKQVGAMEPKVEANSVSVTEASDAARPDEEVDIEDEAVSDASDGDHGLAVEAVSETGEVTEGGDVEATSAEADPVLTQAA